MLFVLAVTTAGAALAHDPNTGWTQPGTGASRCNGMAMNRSLGNSRRMFGSGAPWTVLARCERTSR